MNNNIRDSGIDIIGGVPWGTHFCQFYQTREDLIDILVPYFKAGLENNELCVWIISQPLEVEEAKAAMQRAIPDIDAYLKRGQIEIVPYTHGYLKEGVFDPERVINSWVEKINQALERGYDGLRAAGDNRWLEKEGWNDFVDYENKVDAIIDKYHVIGLCPYYLDMCSTAEIIDIISNHQFALIKREGKWERIENSGRKRAEKEAIQAAENWKYTFDTVPDLIAIIDDKYRVVRANRAMAAKLGRTPEECIGLICYRAIHGTAEPPSFCPQRQLLMDEAEHTTEVCNDCLGGYFAVNTSPLYDSEGKLTGSVYVAHDINEHKQEEHRIRRYNRILEGINQIFSNVVQAKTEEELGEACLSVVLKITGSEFGFINEMGADGLLHDVAKSQLAWEQCFMYDKTGHRRPPSVFALHGLYGSVINNEKGFFTNDPPSHPDSIGIPEGHPPLTSFLGVPLVQGEKTIGLIAVANREGGYSSEQQEDIEAIAPAVVQALQRKRSEEALRLSNLYNRSLIEASLDPLVTIRPDGKIADVNDATEIVTGCLRDELVGTDFSNYFTEPEEASKGYQQVFTQGEVRDYPLEIKHKDGHITPVLYNASVYRDENGEVIGVFAAARDITERKRAEEALRLSEEKFAKAFYGNAADMVITRARDGIIIDVNDRWLRSTGYSRDEVIGRSTNDDIHLWADPKKRSEMIRDLRRLGSIRRLEMEFIDKSGNRRFALLSLQLIMLDGEEAILSSSLDITNQKEAEEALRKSEERFRSLIEQSPVAIAIDRHGLIDYANPRYLEMFRIDSLDDIRGRPFLEVFAPQERMRAKEGWRRIQLGLSEPLENEFIGMRGDGTQFPFYIAVSKIELDGESVNIFFLTDITERRQAEHQLSNELARATGLYELYTQSSNLSDRELCDFAINQAVKITDSTIGFFHFVSEDEKEIILTTWNQEALRSCTAGNEGHYPIEKAGNWVDCVRLKRPVVYNDFPSSPNQKGLPAGHTTVKRLMSVPVIENGKVRIIFGVGNKVDEYNDRDVMQFQLVANELHKIIKLRRIENEVRESEAFLRNIMENVSDAIFVKDRESRIILANPAYYRLMGKSPEEILNKTVADLHPPEIARKLVEDDKRVMETGEGTTLEERIFTSHGWRILQTVKSPYYDGQGNIIGLTGAARDITERKEAEEALKKAYDNLEKLVKERTAELEKAYNSLKESERGLAEAQEMAHIGNWDWDIATDKTYWSEELYRIFKRDPQKLAPTINEFHNYIHPDDRHGYVNLAYKALNEKSSLCVDLRIILDDGEERRIHIQSGIIFDEKNIPIRIKGIVQDITEGKRTEEKIQILANAVESSNDAIVTLSLEGIVTSWNKAAELVYGYSVEEIVGKDVSILEPDSFKGEIKRFSEKIKQGKNVQHYETSRVKKDGTAINISVALSPIFDMTGKLVAISAIVRDVTERIRAEEALRESEARLRQFYESDMIGVFYYNQDGSITDANDKLLKILGYTREDLQAGEVNWNRITLLNYCLLDEQCTAELKTTDAKEPKEQVYIRKDGSQIPVIVGSATLNNVRNEGIAFVLDITEKKKAEEALANIEITRKKEIHHRIKNNLQVISSLLDLQADKFDNPKVIEAFRESQNRVISMALIHEELYKGEGTDTLDFCEYIQELAENLFQTYSLSSKNIRLNMDLEESAFFDMDVAVPLGIIVNELVSNSLKHAFPDRKNGEIRIKLSREDKEEWIKSITEGCKGTSFTLTVSDDGAGIPENLSIEDLDSLGFQLITSLIDQLDGEFELKRKNGTEFTMRFTVTEKGDMN